MKDKGTARRYASAILSCADNDKEIRGFGSELAQFSDAYRENSDLKKILLHPGIQIDSKKNVLADICKKLKFSKTVGQALIVILENGRMNLIVQISEIYTEMSAEKLGEVAVHVSSAHPLSSAENAEVEKLFSSITGKKAKVEVKVDELLIGGIVARVGSKVYDGSVSNQLKLMGIKLRQEA
ncbi:MAG: ATP synthase F1 subunit delta [Nitrospinota bacterium]|nr:ATP synthase F1 subunit delta [Nitrospinota bacterium]